MIVGGEWVKTTMDLDLFYGPVNGSMPDADKLAPSLWVIHEGVQTKGYVSSSTATRRAFSTIRSASRIRRTRRSPCYGSRSPSGFPAAYKASMIAEFTKNVLMK